MQDPVVRTPKVELRERIVRIGDKVPVGKEQKLDDVPNGLKLILSAIARGSGRTPLDGWKIYVSHIDIFLAGRYRERDRDDGIS
jgi:hypothetical protein